MNENEVVTEKKRPNKTVIIILAVLAAVLFGLVIYRIFFVKKEVDTTPLSTVTVELPQTGSIEVETALVGTRMPGEVYYALPMTAGKVTKIYVKVGDHVKKGDKICDIDNQKQIDAAKISLDSAELQIKTVEDSIELAKTNLDRMEALFESGDISKQSYEQVKNSYDQAVAGLDGAKLQYDGAKLQYDTQVEFGTVTAPSDGVVESTSMTVDTYVSQSSPVAIISGDGSGKVTFNITDRLLSSVKEGDEVRYEKLGSTYFGAVTSVSQMPGQTTGLYEVKASIEDGGAIPTGASVKVYFVSEKTEDAMLVPTGAIYYDGGRTYIYTVSYPDESSEEEKAALEGHTVLEGSRPAIVHKKEIVTGLSDADSTEVLSGLEADEEIIVTWTAQLYEGARVQVLSAAVAGGNAQ